MRFTLAEVPTDSIHAYPTACRVGPRTPDRFRIRITPFLGTIYCRGPLGPGNTETTGRLRMNTAFREAH